MRVSSDPKRLRPIEDPPADRETNAQASHPVGSVLIVEDDEVNRQIATAALEKLGYRCRTASDGEQAIIALACNRYDVVLMDCQMPVMDGFEATRRIRVGDAGVANITIPIVALTSDTGRGVRERCHEAGMNDYLAKPFNIECLGDLLTHLLPGNIRRK